MSQKRFGQACIMETANKIFPVLPRYKKKQEMKKKTLMYDKTHLSAKIYKIFLHNLITFLNLIPEILIREKDS